MEDKGNNIYYFINNEFTKMEAYITKKLSENKFFSKIKFIKSSSFKKLIGQLYSSNDEEQLKQNLLSISQTLLEQTNLGLSYQNAAIWQNHGLDLMAYSGSGSVEYYEDGFGSSRSQYSLMRPCDVFDLTSDVLKYITAYLIINDETITDKRKIWQKLVKDYHKSPGESYFTHILGELYFELMPPKDLSNLRIEYNSHKLFDSRTPAEKASMDITSLITSDILPLVLQKAAKYNLELKKTPQSSTLAATKPIYFSSKDGEFREIKLNAPRSDIIKFATELPETDDLRKETNFLPLVERLKDSTSKLVFTKLKLEELVKKLEGLLPNGTSLDTMKDRQTFMHRSFLSSLLEKDRLGQKIEMSA